MFVSSRPRIHYVSVVLCSVYLRYLVLHILFSSRPHTHPTSSSYSASEVFFGRDRGGIGGEYLKVIYVEYTDDTFTVTKPPSPNSQHLGILGKDLPFLAKFQI